MVFVLKYLRRLFKNLSFHSKTTTCSPMCSFKMPKEKHALNDDRKISSLKRDLQRGNKVQLLLALKYYFSINMACNTSELLTRVSEVIILVVFSPTRDGRVWDIQFEIIAMVLRTAPSFSSGGLIAVELMRFHGDGCSSRCRLAGRGVTAARSIHSRRGDQAYPHLITHLKHSYPYLPSVFLLLLTNTYDCLTLTTK